MSNGGIIGPVNDPTRGYTGGTVTPFTASGCFSKSPTNTAALANVLVVAGGGGGGHAGGGGAGGYIIISCQPIPASAVPVTIGAGGVGRVFPATQPTSGSDSVFGTASSPITSTGGGRGGSGDTAQRADGGSGGGGPGPSYTPAPLIPTYNPGGAGNTPPVSPPQGFAGGSGCGPNGGAGGGATAVGTSGGGGSGGAGADASPIFGVAPQTFYPSMPAPFGPESTFSGGGGGGGDTTGTGGSGGGGAGASGNNTGTSGQTNRGGGGGGIRILCATPGTTAGAGGSGIVLVQEKNGNFVASGVWSLQCQYNFKKAGQWTG